MFGAASNRSRPLVSSRSSEAHATADRETEVVAEKRIIANLAIRVEHGAGIAERAIAHIDSHERTAGRIDLDSASEIDREHCLAGGEHTLKRWRKNRDAGKRPRRLAKAHEPRSRLGERPHLPNEWSSGDAAQHFDSAAAERGGIGKILQVERDLSFWAEPLVRTPRGGDADACIGGIEFRGGRRHELNAQFRARLRLRNCRTGQRYAQQHADRAPTRVRNDREIHLHWLSANVAPAAPWTKDLGPEDGPRTKHEGPGRRATPISNAR